MVVILEFCVLIPTVTFNCHNTPSILIYILEGSRIHPISLLSSDLETADSLTH